MRKRIARMAGLLAVALTGMGPLAGFGQGRELVAPVCVTPPQIDAVLTDACWQAASKYDGFLLVGTDQPAPVQTTAWLCRDDAFLYIAFRCDEPSASTIRNVVRKRDGGVTQDDSIEVFIDPGTGGKTYVHLTLNPGNTQGDSLVVNRVKQPGVNFPWRSAAQVDAHMATATGWSAEIAFPISILQEKAGTGLWTLNLCRSRRAMPVPEYSCLAKLPPKASFHSPEYFLPLNGLTGFPARVVFGPMLESVTANPMSIKGDEYSYAVTVTVKNMTSRGGTVEVVAQDIPRDGKATSTVQAMPLQPLEEKQLALTIPVQNPEPRQGWVGIREPGATAWLQKRDVEGLETLSPFEAYLERSYYTDEKQARVCVEMLMARETLAAGGLKAAAELLDGAGKTMVSGSVNCESNIAFIPVALDKVAPGMYPVRVSVISGKGVTLGTVTAPLQKLPPPPTGANELKIDRYNRCLLLNGKPFFPFGPLGISYGYERLQGRILKLFEIEYAYCREVGYNVVWDWAGFGRDRPVEDCKLNYDLAQKYGMKVIGMPYRGTREWRLRYTNPNFKELVNKTIDYMDPYLEMARQHPAVIAYTHFDEPPPGMNLDDTFEAFTAKIRKFDRWHPVLAGMCVPIPSLSWFETVGDLISMTMYWHPSAPASLLNLLPSYAGANRMQAKAHAPSLFVTQLERTSSSYLYPTPAEQWAQTYCALVNEGRGIFYFLLPIRHRLTLEAHRDIAAHIAEISPALLTRTPKQELSYEPREASIRILPDLTSPLVLVLLKNDPKGGQVLLALNTARQPVTVRFAVSTLTPDSKVKRISKDGQKPYAVNNGAFTDTLEPVGTRAYRLEGVRVPKDEPVRIALAMSGPAVAQAAQAGGGANLVANPGFEGAGEWKDSYVAAGGWTFETVTNAPHAGTHCLRIAKPNPEGTADVLSAPIVLKPNTRYRYGGWIRSSLTEGKSRPQLLLVSADRKQINTGTKAPPSAGSAWAEGQGTFTTPNEPLQPVSLWCRIYVGCTGDAWFDDLYLQELGPAETKRKNLIANSDFEYARMEGVPDLYEFPVWHFMLPDPQVNAQWKDRPFHGKACFRLTRPADSDDTSGLAWARTVMHERFSVPGNRTYTFSAYLRADKPDTAVTFRFAPPETAVKVGTEWQRYAITRTLERGDSVAVGFNCKEVLYIDALQLEEGDQATAYEPDGYVSP